MPTREPGQFTIVFTLEDVAKLVRALGWLSFGIACLIAALNGTGPA